jgi:hypothetical protein
MAHINFQPSRRRGLADVALGNEDAFAPHQPNARYVIGKEAFA